MKYLVKLLIPMSLTVHGNTQVVMRFQPHITPHARLLGDIVLISEENEHWMAIPLASQPKAGEQISKKQIIQWLIRKNGQFTYLWRGKNRALIQQSILTKGNDLINKAESTLKQQLLQRYESVELTVKTKVKNTEFPLSSYRVDLPKNDPPARQICVRLNHDNHSIPVWFTIKTYQKVLVAKYKIKTYTPAHESHFVLQKRNIAGLRSKPLTELPPKSWLKNSINKNQILTQDDLIKIPQIIKGQSVEVTVQHKGISLSIEAIAQSNGYKGQLIRMLNPASHKFFIAQITAPNKAEIKI
ncbi:hypothetical protein EP47_09165 [Legionella norrlandica]|uniref:Flagella basal body P-ring formation protein FlgA SAF domain-containing protein n=1 Tax=Legionella norrlandica TaxID=1498499 RepID=A0A0A2SU92_9GAMM|nr:flagellar basal body P-ring formation chaperone FlgA [Legionella norrlandica]KGP63291.1 hypothetical protein EP47_09165 [Legionella norrlandica]